MKVRVLLFGPFAEAAGTDCVDVHLEARSGATAAQVQSALAEHMPSMSAMVAAARLAVNHRFAAPEQTVQESDELALIGLVGGG